MIRFEHLSFSYDECDGAKRAALCDLSFSVSEGEIIGIVGHTGSGKSTLAQLICGLLSPTEGKLFVCGKNLSECKSPAAAIRGEVGLVFQYPEHQLFEETVFRDIAFAGKNLGLSDFEIEERVKEAMQLTGISEDLRDRSPFELSGGQKRRVAIAGVLVMRPKILILDEPAAGLDPMGRKEIIHSILSFQKKYGTTLIFVSHSMEEVVRIAERALVFCEGRLSIDGSVQEVFSDPEKLRAIGLDVPIINQIVCEANELGVPVDRHILTMPEAVAELTAVLGGTPI